ncbi:hypothetical protein V8E36_009824 [Tilletia maclaganii]
MSRLFFISAIALALSLLSPVAAAGADASGIPSHAPGVDPTSILYYSPRVLPNAVFAVLYGIVSAVLYIRLIHMRDWWGLCLPIGSTFQAIGFVLRIILRSSPGSLGLYIMMDFFIVLSPACYFAISYIIFGRFAHNLQHDATIPKRKENITLLRPRLFGTVFIISDVVTFIVQAAGGAMQTNPDLSDVGAKIFLTGIILQGVSYIIFLVCCFYTHAMVTSRAGRSHPLCGRIQKLFFVLYFASVWIIVRSVYRTIELAQGFRGALITNETYFFLLDSLPLLLCILTWAVIWPSSVLPLQHSDTGFSGAVHAREHAPLAHSDYELEEGRKESVTSSYRGA